MSISIDINKVDEKIVEKYLRKFDIKANGKIVSKVNALEAYQREESKGGHTKDSDISAPCSNCGGESDMNLPECPFCGAKDSDVVEQKPEVEPAAAASEETQEEGDAAPATVVEQKPESEPAAAAETTAEATAPVVEGAPVKKQKLTKLKREVVETTGRTIVDTKKLDAAVDRVHGALRQGANAYWELGTALLDIFDNQLWKQRVDESGRQQFSSWNLFCRDELAMSHVNAFSIMDAARAFSKKDFEDLGHSKLSLLLRLPKERQQMLLQEAKNGRLPRARLKEIIEAEVPKNERRETGRRKTTEKAGQAGTEVLREKAAAKRKVLPRPDGEITAVSQLGRTKLALYARANVKKPKEKPSRAVSVNQDPWCEEELVNGVVVRYTVVKGAKGLELIIERKRPDAATH